MITDNDENYLTLEEIRYCLGKREISDIAENFIKG